jgi:hypothetical protein
LQEWHVVDDSTEFAVSVLAAHAEAKQEEPPVPTMDIEIGVAFAPEPTVPIARSTLPMALWSLWTVRTNPCFSAMLAAPWLLLRTPISFWTTLSKQRTSSRLSELPPPLGPTALLKATFYLPAGTAITFGTKSVLHGWTWTLHPTMQFQNKARDMERQLANMKDLDDIVSTTTRIMEPLVGFAILGDTAATEGYTWITFLLYFLGTFNVVYGSAENGSLSRRNSLPPRRVAINIGL